MHIYTDYYMHTFEVWCTLFRYGILSFDDHHQQRSPQKIRHLKVMLQSPLIPKSPGKWRGVGTTVELLFRLTAIAFRLLGRGQGSACVD